MSGCAVAKPIACDGETHSRVGWGRLLRGCRGLVTDRILRGWRPCKAATMPKNERISAASKLNAAKRAARRLVRIRGTWVLRTKLP
jgi:hypothetical protein